MINGTLTLVESRLTDVTGRTQFTVATNTLYVFTSDLANYESKQFTLNPVIFTSYNVQLKKITTISTPLDYENIAITYNPKIFVMGQNNFTIETKGNGQLTNYGYTLTSSCNTKSGNGNNAYGGTLSTTFNLNNTCITNYDKLTLFYYYETSAGDYRNFTDYIGLSTAGQSNYSGNMQVTLGQGTYGMGLFERILITTIITLILVGVVASVGGLVAGLFVGLIILAYFTSVGFIPLSVVIITLFASFVLVISFNKRG
jgi:ABC-type dipeptide/oligopeptide/nickel transport system permease subunit